jgi:hypothetical protein
MATKVTLKDLINSIDPQIKNILYENTRKVLDVRPHVLDISYQSLLVNNKDKRYANFDELHAILLKVVREKATRTYNSIEQIPRGHFTGSTPYLVYIDNGPNQQLLMAKSFDAIRTFVTDKISKDPRLVDSVFGLRKEEKPILNKKGLPSGDTKVTYISNLDIGHIASSQVEGGFTSPLAEKLAGIIDYASISGGPTLKYAEQALDKIMSIQADIQYSFRNSTPEVFQLTEKTFGQAFITVTLHTSDINQKEFGDEELKVFNQFQEKLALLASKALRDKYLENLTGSNSILEDIGEALIGIAKTGKSNNKTHQIQKQKSPTVTIGSDKKIPDSPKISASFSKPKTSIEEATINLMDLQTLLDLHLQDVISANMGSGERNDILNYRTGRFAGSVKVEKLTMSRQGMITAFYNYMKYPYATFSEGGRQSKPTSRDPKLLISKSIREIVSEKVAARLRAVVV